MDQLSEYLVSDQTQNSKKDRAQNTISPHKMKFPSEKRDFVRSIDNEEEGIVIIQDGILKYVNNASEYLLGFDPKELTGKVFYEFISPEYRKLVMDRYHDRMDGNAVTSPYEIELLDKNGTTIPVQIKSELISFGERAAVMVFIKKISESKLAEQKMKHFQEYIEDLVDSKTSDLNVIIDKLILLVTDIKSENKDLQKRLEMESLVSNVILRSLSPSEINKSITASLRDVGRLSGAESATLLIIDDDNGLLTKTHEWLDNDSEPVDNALKRFPLDKFNSILMELRKGEALYLSDVSKLPVEIINEIAILNFDKTKSVLMLPVFIDNILRGLIIFRNIDPTISWDDENLSVHHILSDLIGNIFGRIRITQ